MKNRTIYSTTFYSTLLELAEQYEGMQKDTQFLEFIRYLASYHGTPLLTPSMMEGFVLYFDTSKRTLEDKLKKFSDKGILLRTKRGEYLANPRFIWSYRKDKRKKAMQLYENIQKVKDATMKKRYAYEYLELLGSHITRVKAEAPRTKKTNKFNYTTDPDVVQNYKVDYGDEYE